VKKRRAIPLPSIQFPRWIPTDHSIIGLGLDVATTEKEKSNPSALAITELVGSTHHVRLLIRWKTADPEITFQLLLGQIMAIAPRRPRKLCIDATSERFFATNLKRRLGALVHSDLIVSSESIEYLGEKMSLKAYLGNLLVNTIDDGRLALPPESWVADDFRLVKRDRGSFTADLAPDGGHADAFDAVKLSIHAIAGPGGPAAAAAAAVGTMTQPAHRHSLNPFARMFNKAPQINV
jgi:hypothetical protein